jgi:hypothetical protein
MGFVSILQGGALADRYRALLLVRAPAGALTVSGATAGGLAGERLRLAPAARPPLDALLWERRLYAVRFEADGLRPMRAYRFTFSDGASTNVPLDTYTLPARLPEEGITVAVGTCFFEGFGMGPRLGAVLRRAWLGHRPLLQFWGGDNLYVDVPSFGLLSANKPYVHTLERYLKYFDGTAYMAARATTPNYTTYDDHEFWNNFPESQPHLSRDDAAQRGGYTQAGWACLDLFQSSLNPDRSSNLFPSPQDPARNGRSFVFDLPPLSFFFADVRSNRDRQRPAARMMTREDLIALRRWAAGLAGPGVLVLGQPLFMNAGGKTDFNPPAFPDEYRAIWASLRSAPFDVLVVSGDVHHSRVVACSLANDPNRRVYEFVSSPASHIPTLLTTVLPWYAQDQGTVAVPEAFDDTGQRVKPTYYFGTNAQNTIGMLSFTPRAGGAVEVGAAFVDYGGDGWPRIPVSQRANLPFEREAFPTCTSGTAPLFTLRQRP